MANINWIRNHACVSSHTLVNGIYKLRAHAHRHGGSMGAYGTSQGGGGLGGTPHLGTFVPWFVTGPLRAG